MYTKAKFLSYVNDFYGNGGIYDMGITSEDLEAAYNILASCPLHTIEFDSIDREHLRDILIEKFGYQFPEKCRKNTTLKTI